MYRSRLVFASTSAVFFTLMSLLGGCQQPSTSDVDQTEEGVVRLGSVEAVDTLSRGVALNDRPLIIEGFRGTIVLTGSDQETAELTFVRRGRGEDAEAAREVLEDVTVTESGSEEAYTYTLEAEGESYAAIDVRGTVPRSSEVRVEQTNGAVTITEVEGPLSVTHEHGPVRIRDAAESVEVETKNGTLGVGMRAVPAGAEIGLRTRNGDVGLRLPTDASVQLVAETSVGHVRMEGLPFTDEQFLPRDAGGEYTAQMGGGDATADLRTENGSIVIQPTDTTRESSEEEALAVPPSDTTVVGPPFQDTTDFEESETDTSEVDRPAVDTMEVDTTE